MRKIIGKLFRLIENYTNELSSEFRKIVLRLKYPSISIKGKSYIGRRCNIVVSNNASIEFNNTYLSNGVVVIATDDARIKIGKSFIGLNCIIAAKESIEIGNDCAIAEFVIIRDQNHKHDMSSKIIENQGFDVGAITIEDNVWIGSKATILKGVTIGRNTVLGANSLANKSIPKSSKFAGTPARNIIRNG